MADSRPTTFNFRQDTPVKVGLIMDMVAPRENVSYHSHDDFIDGLTLGFEEARASGLVNRPIEVAYREVEGLPRGTAKAVIEGFRELVEDEGCLIILGPATSESAYPAREYLEQARVPAITMAGTDDFLGEWTFSLSFGSLPDEPIQLANVIAGNGHRRVAVVYERYKVGNEDLRNFRLGASYVGLNICTEVPYEPSSNNDDIVAQLRESKPDAIVSLVRQLVGRTGEMSLNFNEALEKAGWSDVPRYVTSAWTNAWFDNPTWEKYRGWIGLEMWDEENQLGKAVMDRFEARFGRRPGYCQPLYAWDAAQTIARAIGGAFPLTHAGVRDSLERIKLVPAATGSPGTCISFGKWTRRGWSGPGYMVARTAIPGTYDSRFAGRVEPWTPR